MWHQLHLTERRRFVHTFTTLWKLVYGCFYSIIPALLVPCYIRDACLTHNLPVERNKGRNGKDTKAIDRRLPDFFGAVEKARAEKIFRVKYLHL